MSFLVVDMGLGGKRFDIHRPLAIDVRWLLNAEL